MTLILRSTISIATTTTTSKSKFKGAHYDDSSKILANYLILGSNVLLSYLLLSPLSQQQQQ